LIFFPSGFAALQLFGALMPRFLGQKRRRIDNNEDTSDPDDTLTMALNAVTAQELFSRHVDLAPFLLKKLQECQLKEEINPSLVPILSMLSRVSPGLQSQDDITSECQLDDFVFQSLSQF
jgi:hypothetical protein